MSDDTMRLAARIVGAWSEHCFGSTHWSFHDGAYRIASEDEYKALGEDPDAEDAPLILTRESDGAFFEVELDAHVWRTTPEERKAEREQLDTLRARLKQQQGVPA